MKDIIRFLREKPPLMMLDFLFIRVGKTAPLLSTLQEISAKWDSEEVQIQWQLIERDSLAGMVYPSKLPFFDGIVLNLDVNDENLIEMRKQFWEEVIWKTENLPKPLAIVIPSSKKLGSLSKSQTIEGLSLQRVTDRPWELFETSDEVPSEIFSWLMAVCNTFARKKEKALLLEQEEVSQS